MVCIETRLTRSRGPGSTHTGLLVAVTIADRKAYHQKREVGGIKSL